MGSSLLLGFRPPQFSEDIAWLPAWLQPHALNEHIKEGQSTSEHRFEDLPFLQQNFNTGEGTDLSSKDIGRYKSCQLFLSGEDNSSASFSPSTDDVVHFHLRLSSNGDSENVPSSVLATSQPERFESNHALVMQGLQTSGVHEEKIYKFKPNYNVGVANLPPTPQDEKFENLGPQSLSNNEDKGTKQEENVCFLKVVDINDAVELSIAASEALIIREGIKSGSTTIFFPPSTILEVALRVKQARLEGLKETFHSSTEEISEIDFLSDLDETTMADAYEDVGLSVTGPGDLHGFDSVISQVKDTYASEDYGSDDRLKYDKLGVLQLDSGDISRNQQSKSVTNVDKQLNKDLLESFDGGCEKKLIDDPDLIIKTGSLACEVDPLLHWSVQKNPDISSKTEKVDFAVDNATSFQENVNSSPRVRSSDNAERENPSTYLVADKFQSRWLGGWTWKKEVNASTLMQHNNASHIPEFFVGETSFLSESADIAPDENSFVQKKDIISNIVSQSSIPFEGLLNKGNEGILLSVDVMSSPCPSFVDPLCSVVPCSISSENECSTLAQNHKDKVDTGKCSNPTPEHSMANLRRTALNIDFVHGELAVPVTNSEVPQPTVRRELTSLRNYSTLLPSHGVFSECGSFYCNRSSPKRCNVKLLSSVMQSPVTDLKNEARNCDETARDVAEVPIHLQKGTSSPLIVGDQNPERTAVPERDVPQSMELQKEESKCKNPHYIQDPVRKRVRFSEAEVKLPQKKKLQMLQTIYRNCSTTRCAKRPRSSNPHSESSSQEVKRRLTKCCDKDRKRLIFQNIEFLLSGFSGKKEKEIEGLIRKYGGIVLSEIPSPNSRGKRYSRFKRQPLPVILCFKKLQTTKLLYGCAVNACMLKANWLTDSIVAGSVLPPEKYRILASHADDKCTRIGKPALCSNRIFDNMGIMFHGKHNFCTKMAKVVKHGDGLVFNTLQWLVQSLDSEKISLGVIVTEDESRVSRHLKHCASEQKIHVMPASWIINSLYAGKLLPIVEKNSPRVTLLDIQASMELSEEI